MKKTLIIFNLIFGLILLQGQNGTKALATLPTEGVYVHSNTDLAFAGEYIYYQFYSFLTGTGNLSPISKMGYVDLINETEEVVFHHKLKLSNGTAASDYFIPSDIPSGNYKLVGYTQWMRNGLPDHFFYRDLTIINPYRGDQRVFLQQTLDSLETKKDAAQKPLANKDYGIRLNKTTFSKREMARITLSPQIQQELKGHYSLSVRKKETLPAPSNKNISKSIEETLQVPKPETIAFLPESRGDFIAGKLITDAGTGPAKLVISFPGDNNILKIATTDQNGFFRTQVYEAYTETNLHVTPLNDMDISQIRLETDSVMNYGELTFHQFQLHESMRETILQRSVQNQIENAYFHLRPDSVVAQQPNIPFYDGEITRYLLDDYTRFSTIRETAVEILEHVWIREENTGKINFRVRPLLPLQDNGEPPLVLLDGAFIEDHGKLLQLPSKSVNSISIGRDQYLYGPHTFQGVIEVKTIEGNSYFNYLAESTKVFPYQPTRIQKKYYQEHYNSANQSAKEHIPDFRRQLLWTPNINIQENVFEAQFFTSDLEGEFEIILEGISNNGKPITATTQFQVN